MRKRIMVATLFVAFAVITGMNVYNAQKSDMELSGLALENVEALADYEVEIGPWYCIVDWHICHIFGPGDTLDGIKYNI